MKTLSLFKTFFTLILCNSKLVASRTSPEVLKRDVCIIGGGSAGTHAAIRLYQMNKSVALIDKKSRLGGHVDTFVDPRTNTTFDYGVVVFTNNSQVRNYFDYLNVPLKNFTGSVPNETTIYANLATGTDLAAPNMSGLVPALLRYKTQLEKYPYLSTGFHLQYPIPQDLLLPFGDFCDKYNIGEVAQFLLPSNGGYGNLLATPTLYLMKQFSMDQVQSTLADNEVTSAAEDNQALYDNARDRLGENENAFVSSHVTWVNRSQEDGIIIHINTPDGKKIIHASKLVIATPPNLATLTPFLDLSDIEYTYLSQFNNSYLWASLVRNSGIPENAALENFDPAAALEIPAMPQVYGTAPTPVKGLHIAWYRSPYAIPTWEVKQNIEKQFNGWQGHKGNSAAEVITIKNHSPYTLEVPLVAIQAGFYEGLNKLQGLQGTYWTGAAWESNDSPAIWKFNEEELLPMIIASLNGSRRL